MTGVTPDTDPLLARAEMFCRKHALLGDGTMLVAVSGGADSVCLLDVLRRLAPDLGLTLHVAHFHHGLRREADTDAAFVAARADELAIPATFGSADVGSIAAATHQSLEAAAHHARWDYLEGVRRRIGATAVAVGHTGDDQAETVLLHLLRGAGLGGLAGLAPRQGHVVRPLLALRHAECQEWCRTHGIAWREDASNSEPWCPRNSIRLEVLPFLRRYNPAIDAALATTADTLQADLAYIQDQTAAAYAALIAPEGDGTGRLDLTGYAELPLALRRRTLLRWFGAGATSRHVQAADSLLVHGQAGSAVDLPGDRRLVKRYVDAILVPRGLSADPGAVALNVPGVTLAPEWGWRITSEVHAVHPQGSALSAPPGRWVAAVDAAKVRLPLTLRPRRAGDRMRLAGVGTRKVQDMLVDAKLPRAERDRVGVIASPDGIVWLVGQRVAAWAYRDEATERILRITVSPLTATDEEDIRRW